MAATVNLSSFGRIATYANLAGIEVTINANGATYATGTGVPIDLTSVLTQGAPFSQGYLNPADVVAIIPQAQSSPGKYLPLNLQVGTPTYTALPGASVRVPQVLATCPATVQLFNGATEFAAGACSETFTVILLVARGGTNIN